MTGTRTPEDAIGRALLGPGARWSKTNHAALRVLHTFVADRQPGLWQEMAAGRAGAEHGVLLVSLGHWIASWKYDLTHDWDLNQSEAVEWLRLLAACPDFETIRDLEEEVLAPSPRGGKVWSVRLTSLRRPRRVLDDWRSAGPRDLVPWAWAAGFTPEETTKRYRSGSLDADALRTLAALRGFVLPA